MDFSFRTYQKADFPALITFLNKNLDYDELSAEVLSEKLEGDPFWDPENALICQHGDHIVGFIQGVTRDIHDKRYGYIKLMAVDKSYRRQGIARELYNRLETLFIAQSVDNVRIYDVPMNYFMPGIDPRYTEGLCFAIRMGFSRFGDTANLLVDLDASDWETKNEEKLLESHGIKIDRLDLGDREMVSGFVCEHFPLWQHEIDVAFQDMPPSIHVAWLHGKIKAFSAHNGNNKGTGWFGPMGTHADLRGKGIGSILLKRCLKDMKNQGHLKAIIPWVGPIEFYAHHASARVDRVFWRYEKKLKLS